MEPGKTEIILGPESLQQLPALVRKYGSRPLLVHGHRPVEDGLLEKVRVVLTEAGIPHSNMGQILPNPKFSSVKRGVKIARKDGCDLILAVGGGSTLQCAKGIGYGMYNEKKDLWSLWTGKRKPAGMMAVASVLTNPATGDELDNACTLVKGGKQMTLTSEYGVCSFALLDPALSQLPFYPTMCQSFEMFVYLFVRYLDCAASQEDAYLGWMKSLLASAAALESDQTDIEARTALFKVSLEAHRLDVPAASGIGHLAGRLAYHWSLPRGAALSALFFAWSEGLEDTPQLDKMAKVLFDKDAGKDGLRCIRKEVEKMQLPVNIPAAGLVLKNKDLKKLARDPGDLALLKKANRK